MRTHIVHEYYGLDVKESTALLTAYFPFLDLGDFVRVEEVLWVVTKFERYASPLYIYIVELRKVE